MIRNQKLAVNSPTLAADMDHLLAFFLVLETYIEFSLG